MPTAARMTDTHVCHALTQPPTPPVQKKCCCEAKPVTPAPIPHVGGVVLAGSPNVNIEGLKAARTGDAMSCTGVPTADVIVTGAAKIFINGQLAAMTGSLGAHVSDNHGLVTGLATKTNYGAAMAGATFGDPTAATAACMAAAAGRGGSQAQNKPMNCGVESVRQLCAQKCAQTGDTKACACASMSEDAFYKKYLTDEKSTYNAALAKEAGVPQEQLQARYQAVFDKNDKAWKANATATNYCGLSPHALINAGRSPSSSKQWQNFQGKTIYFFDSDISSDSSSNITIDELPGQPITDDVAKQDADGTVGSYPDTRASLLAECGVGSGTGANTQDGIAGDLASGKTVLAVVDVGTLNGQGGGGKHTITVSQMVYDASGNLVSVTVNDTSQKNGCGMAVTPPSRLGAALIPGNQTNTVP